MSNALLVLYVNIKTANQCFCLYYGGWEEADSEQFFMERDGFTECGRIEVDVEEITETRRVITRRIIK